MKPPRMTCAASARRLQQLACWRFLSLFYMYLICFHTLSSVVLKGKEPPDVVRCFLPLPPAAPRSRHAFVARPGRAAASVT